MKYKSADMYVGRPNEHRKSG